MMSHRIPSCLSVLFVLSILISLPIFSSTAGAADTIDLGSRRELFVDHFLIDKLEGTALALNRPKDEGVVIKFDKPWEGPFAGYVTILRDGDKYRMYYRGLPTVDKYGRGPQVTCTAESKDAIHWTKPSLGLFEVNGSTDNNVVLADAGNCTHNFSPFIDTRPGVPKHQRYKALGGSHSVLLPFASADGLRWKKLSQKSIIGDGDFDSHNIAFWSATEGCYVCYYRKWVGSWRVIRRATSKDFLNWSIQGKMESFHDGKPTPKEQIYTSQTLPYFRAPHIYVSIAARLIPGRQVITDAQAKAINVRPGYYKDTSDTVLMTSRGGNRYDRTFMESFMRPEIGPSNWVSHANFSAWGIVQTGPDEISFYVKNDYAQPTHCLRRYSARLDGFASVHAPYGGGSMLTKPFTFKGEKLSLNFATSAAGDVKIEIQDAAGKPIPGFTLADSKELIGNETDRVAAWKGDKKLGSLAGKPIRLRFAMKDADLYSIKFY